MEHPTAMFENLRKNVNSHKGMSEEEFNLGTTFFAPKKLRKRQYVLQAGDVCKWLVFIERGCLRLYSIDDLGKEHVLRFGIEGWWMTDLESFQGLKPSAANIDALEDSELLLIGPESLQKLSDTVPIWDRYFRVIIDNEFKAAMARISDFVGASAEDRYLNFLDLYPDLFQRIPLHQIASYLGVTPQTLSRIRKQLSKHK